MNEKLCRGTREMVMRKKKCAESIKNGAEWARDGAKCAGNTGEERDIYF